MKKTKEIITKKYKYISVQEAIWHWQRMRKNGWQVLSNIDEEPLLKSDYTEEDFEFEVLGKTFDDEFPWQAAYRKEVKIH